MAWGQISLCQASYRETIDNCEIREARGLPGSHQFASDFIEAIAADPDPGARAFNVVWGLTADLSDRIPLKDRAIYISKSIDGGETWTGVARVDARYFDAGIGEGLRNGLGVTAGGTDFVITTQQGAFQVLPGAGASDAEIRPIAGPRVCAALPWLSLPKVEGDPVKADAVAITADGRHMVVAYGYFDLDPQLFTYRRDKLGRWVDDGPLPRLPTQMDIFSMQFDIAIGGRARSLYVGTGDQAFRLDLHTKQWTRVTGVGPDSAIHGMSLVGGPHLAACWGVYNPLGPDAVQRVTQAKFLLHRALDEVGPNIRAYGIEVDSAKPNREVVTAITGVYVSEDFGKSWSRINTLPEGEFRTAHFNADGSVIVSGIAGTFVIDPFSKACLPRLRTRTP